jgi:DNA modification methylase
MIELIHGDCLDKLKAMKADSIDSIVTDPPYGLSFMGKKWDYDVPSVEIWKECLRVLKPGGHLLAFAGTRTQHRMAVRIEDGGFEIRDMIAWVYGSGFPKSHNGEWGGTALKPALEPITMARKPLVGTVAENFEKHGAGGLNVDGCRVDASDGRPLIESKAEASLHAFGNGLNGSRCAGATTQGRWPANLIHDGSDEVVGLFPVTGNGSGKPTIAKRERNKGWCNSSPGSGVDAIDNYGDSGSAARFFYCAKANKADRDEGLEFFPMKEPPRRDDGQPYGMNTNTRRPDGSERKPVAPRRNHHPTVKPTDLMRYLCRLVTPSGGTVLDPFMGSGSTGKAALLEGFNFIGIEREAEYVEIARARITATQPSLL